MLLPDELAGQYYRRGLFSSLSNLRSGHARWPGTKWKVRNAHAEELINTQAKELGNTHAKYLGKYSRRRGLARLRFYGPVHERPISSSDLPFVSGTNAQLKKTANIQTPE